MNNGTVDAWLNALRNAVSESESVDGHSTEDLMELWGCSKRSALDRIGLMVKKGIAECAGSRMGTTISGRGKHTPVYRLKA